MKTLAMLVLVLAACGGKKDSAPASASSSCADAAHAAAASLTASPQLADKVSGLEAVLAKHCTDDKWSSDVIACYHDANGMMAIKACRQKLPKDQADKLLADEIGVMSAAPAK
ncbi:MAG TPA: hypothetical protein VGF94_13910 [Kofleriaceae bacterium]|jgi:hypothetical protein